MFIPEDLLHFINLWKNDRFGWPIQLKQLNLKVVRRKKSKFRYKRVLLQMENKQEEVRRFEILEMLLFSDNF